MQAPPDAILGITEGFKVRLLPAALDAAAAANAANAAAAAAAAPPCISFAEFGPGALCAAAHNLDRCAKHCVLLAGLQQPQQAQPGSGCIPHRGALSLLPLPLLAAGEVLAPLAFSSCSAERQHCHAAALMPQAGSDCAALCPLFPAHRMASRWC